jgi:LacI family transcriptional regulator, galactose operon repressor
VTAEDVARRAGVSPMTVSRVINGYKNVREATREAVLAAAKELSYAPNLAARSLASAEQARIGLPYVNPSAAYISEFLVGMLDEVGRHGAQLVLVRCEPGDVAAERAAVRQLIGGQVSGVLLMSPLSDSAAMREEVEASGLPTVLVGASAPHGDFSCVRIDDRKAAFDMTQRIIELGHRRIGFISGHPNMAASAERQAGFELALRELAPGAEKTIVQGYFSYQSGLLAAERLLSGKKPPSAIFASNDDMAAAVVSVAHRRGLDVPRDVTVVGFDDTSIATTLWPELTTVRQPIGKMAAAGVKLLLGKMRSRRDGAHEAASNMIMAHTLIERQSSAPFQDNVKTEKR